MEPEPSIESYEVVDSSCPKQSGHRDYMLFAECRESDLPSEYRSSEVMAIIKALGKRIVAVEADVQIENKRQTKKGSGIIFKIKKDFYIQTSYHVTEGASEIKVTYTYSTQTREPDTLTGRRCGVCFNQDKALYLLDNAPVELCRDTEIPDLHKLIVTMEPGCKGLLEYYKDGDVYAVHFHIKIPNIKPAHIKFWNNKKIPCNKVQICSKSSECCKVLIKTRDVPSEILNLFRKDLPLKPGDQVFAVAISHPHGGRKTISFGDVDCFKRGEEYLRESDDTPSYYGVVFARHLAATCPGSSGGGIIILHGNSVQHIGYQSYLCMHHGTKNRQEEGPINLSALGLIN